jgi:hypothetical protein
MAFKTIVVIGSRKYRNQTKVRELLSKHVLEIYGTDVVIMSGKCPEKESVDNWAIIWAKIYGCLRIEVPPRWNDAERFFERNTQMAHYADEIIAFIPRNQFRSGTWNCIGSFRKMGKTNYRVFDEEGEEWDRKW